MQITKYIENLMEAANGSTVKDKVRAILIKRGHREKDVDGLIAKEFDHAVKSYPDIKNSPAKIADVIIRAM